MSILIENPFPLFTDTDGDPLEDGNIYIGVAGLNPIASPLQVYWDAALSIPAIQPIRTKGGYPVRSGSPSKLYANANYSILVQNKNGTLVYSNTLIDFFNDPTGATIHKVNTVADLHNLRGYTDGFAVQVLGYYAAGDGGGGPVRYWDSLSIASDDGGSVIRPTSIAIGNPGRWKWKLSNCVDPVEWGAVGDGMANDTAQMQSAIDYLEAAAGGFVHLSKNHKVAGVTTSPRNGSIVIDGRGKVLTISDPTGLLWGLAIGESGYTKPQALGKYVKIINVELVADQANAPLGGIYIAPGAFMPVIENVKFNGFQNGSGAAIYAYNDGYNNAVLNKYSWIDNALLKDITIEDGKNGIWFVGNVNRAGEPGQVTNENTFSQTRLLNCHVRTTELGGHSYHFEGSFARSVFDTCISFLDGDALVDANTNRELATSYHFSLDGNFAGASFISLAGEGGGWIIRLDPSMLPDAFGDNAQLDNLGDWINVRWLNIPDSTRQLLKIIDPPYPMRLTRYDDTSGATVKLFRRDDDEFHFCGVTKIIGDTGIQSGYQTKLITLPEPLTDLYSIDVCADLSHLSAADRILYSSRIDSVGVDSIVIVADKITQIGIYCKVNVNTSQGIQLRYSIHGQLVHPWDYYYP